MLINTGFSKSTIGDLGEIVWLWPIVLGPLYLYKRAKILNQRPANIISYALRGDAGLVRRIDEAEASYNGVIIPLLVYYEVRRGLEASGATVKAQLFERLCARLRVEDMTVADMNEASRIYAERKRQGKPMEDADLLISAQTVARGD